MQRYCKFLRDSKPLGRDSLAQNKQVCGFKNGALSPRSNRIPYQLLFGQFDLDLFCILSGRYFDPISPSSSSSPPAVRHIFPSHSVSRSPAFQYFFLFIFRNFCLSYIHLLLASCYNRIREDMTMFFVQQLSQKNCQNSNPINATLHD